MKAPTAKELVKFRTELGLTQGQMAKKMGLYQGTLSRWESGEHRIPLHFRLVVEYLKLDLQSE